MSIDNNALPLFRLFREETNQCRQSLFLAVVRQRRRGGLALGVMLTALSHRF
jgi:hypothetical protein